MIKIGVNKNTNVVINKAHILPDDVFISLVCSLFQANTSLIMSVAVTCFVSFIVLLDSKSNASIIITGLIFLMGLGRIIVNTDFHKHNPATISPHDARRWQQKFALFAWGQSLAFGALVFFTFTTVNRTADNLLVDATACAIAGAITARNASRPRIALGQLANLLIPIFFACLYREDYRYLILGVLNILFFVASKEVINSLYNNTVKLLMSKREKTELASSLASKNFILDATLENMSHGICVFDANKTLVVANKRYQDLLQLPSHLAQPGTHLREIVMFILITDGQDHRMNKVLTVLNTYLSRNIAVSYVWKFKDGRRLALSKGPMADGGAVVLFDDVTERDRMEVRIAHMASHDHLTDLPNRATLNERLQRKLRTMRDGTSVALLCLDLDRFKAVNDTLGHAAGDVVLCEVARRIRAEMVGPMMAARVGGDEFVIVIPMSDEKGTIALARRLIASLSAPYSIDTHQASIGASIGIAIANDRTMTMQELYRRADVALYQVKHAGRGDISIYADTPTATRRAV